MIEPIALVVGGQLAIVERVIRSPSDHTAIPLEQLESHRSGDARLNGRDKGVDRLPRLREPQAVVHRVGVVTTQIVLDPLEIARDDELLELAVRRVQDDGGRRFVDLA